MTRRIMFAVIIATVCVACGSTAQQREMQVAEAIKSTQRGTVTALDFNIIDADTGEVVQGVTRTATAELKRSVAARRAGAPRTTTDRILDSIMDSLREAGRLLAGKEARR